MSFSVRPIECPHMEGCAQRLQMVFQDDRGNVVISMDWDDPMHRILVDKTVCNASGDVLDHQMYSVEGGNVDYTTYMEVLRAVGFLALDPARMQVVLVSGEEVSPNLLHEPVSAPNVFQVDYV